ncbi:hypothetical protein A6J66_015595 [Yersinia enterocolitica]|nr:hypothetical protein A6J66_015595 [Yersinia enterocolitica]
MLARRVIPGEAHNSAELTQVSDLEERVASTFAASSTKGMRISSKMLYYKNIIFLCYGRFSLFAVSKINQPDRSDQCGGLLPLVGGFRWMI